MVKSITNAGPSSDPRTQVRYVPHNCLQFLLQGNPMPSSSLCGNCHIRDAGAHNYYVRTQSGGMQQCLKKTVSGATAQESVPLQPQKSIAVDREALDSFIYLDWRSDVYYPQTIAAHRPNPAHCLFHGSFLSDWGNTQRVFFNMWNGIKSNFRV